MQTNPLSHNSFLIRDVMTSLIDPKNASRIQLLPSELRETIHRIISDNGNLAAQYHHGLDGKLDDHLVAIKMILVDPNYKREEGTGASFMRGLKSAAGLRIDSKQLQQELSQRTDFRNNIFLDPYSILPKNVLNPQQDLEGLPPETQHLLNNLLWAHMDLKNGTVTDTATLMKACQAFSESASKLSPTKSRELQGIAEYIRKEHQMTFMDAIPPHLLTEELSKKISQLKVPPEIEIKIDQSARGYLEAKRTGNPEFYTDTYVNLLGGETANLPQEQAELIRTLADTFLSLVYPNTQRPSLVFIQDPADGQVVRQNNRILDAIKATEHQLLEHQWALEGFVQSIPGMNLWEKTSLLQIGQENYVLQITTKLNPYGNDKIEMERSVQIPIDLTPFRQAADAPLSAEQKQKLLSFFKKDSPYDATAHKIELKKIFKEELNFLTPKQQMILIDRQVQLCAQIAKGILHAYER